MPSVVLLDRLELLKIQDKIWTKKSERVLGVEFEWNLIIFDWDHESWWNLNKKLLIALGWQLNSWKEFEVPKFGSFLTCFENLIWNFDLG
jgi:hypothetical protein